MMENRTRAKSDAVSMKKKCSVLQASAGQSNCLMVPENLYWNIQLCDATTTTTTATATILW